MINESAVSFFVIYSNGKTDSILSFDKSIKELSVNYEFLNENDSKIRDQIIKDWVERNKNSAKDRFKENISSFTKKELKKNKKKIKEFERNYETVGLAPKYSGLIILDNKNKTFVDYQDYSSLCSTYYANLELGKIGLDDIYEYENFKNFFGFNQIELLEQNFDETWDKKEIPSNILTINDFLKHLNSKYNPKYLKINIDLSKIGWNLISFDFTETGCSDVREYCENNYTKYFNKKTKKNFETFLSDKFGKTEKDKMIENSIFVESIKIEKKS